MIKEIPTPKLISWLIVFVYFYNRKKAYKTALLNVLI